MIRIIPTVETVPGVEYIPETEEEGLRRPYTLKGKIIAALQSYQHLNKNQLIWEKETNGKWVKINPIDYKKI